MRKVLAEADDVQQHPLLVAGQWGDGRVLAFAGDSTWRWQMQGFGDAHRRFWRQCVLWLAKKDLQTDGRVWIRLAGRRHAQGISIDFAVAPIIRKARRSTGLASTWPCKQCG